MASNQHNSVWVKDHQSKVKRLLELHSEGYNFKEIAQIMSKEFKSFFTESSVKHKFYRERNNPENTYEKPFKENIVHKNGMIEHDKLVQLTEEEAKNPNRVMELCGYDPNEWEVVKCEVGFWTYRDKDTPDGKVSRTCRLIVKPKNKVFTDEQIIELMTKNTTPIKLDSVKYKIKDKRMLGIELMDMHFGINTLDDYKDTLARLTHHLEKRVWEKVVITFGSDLMHVDNLKNTTANGTRIQDVDVVQMIEDVKSFYEYLVTKASKQANQVEVIYIKGNHDETTSGMLIHWLDARFREVDNVEVDTTIQEVKVYAWEQIFVALTHGDKGGKRTKNTLATNYPLEWARAKIREFHKGHEHHEQVKDEFGITERTLPTGAKVDQFHKDNSYDSAHRRFQIFEYSGDWLESIHYV